MSELAAAASARVERFWLALFGTSGTTTAVTAHGGDLAGYPGVLAVVRRGEVLITAPPALTPALRDAPPAPVEAVSPAWWAGRLPGWRVLGPSVHAFTDQLPSVDHIGTELATGEDHAHLRAAVPPEEWEESGSAQHVHAWVVRDGGQAVAAAGLATFDGVPADVGVLTVPHARGRGLATRVAARAVTEAVTAHGIARWRSLATNEPSRRLAARLGFHDDALQLAILPAR